LIDIQIVRADFDTLVGRCDSSLVVDFQNNSNTNLAVNSYDWDFSGIATSTGMNTRYAFPDTGTYTISLIAGVGSLCPDTIQKPIRLTNQKIDISATGGEVICQGDTIELTAANVFENYTDFTNFVWSPTQNIISGQGTDTVRVIIDSTITFDVLATNSYGCEDTTSSQGTFRYVWPVVNITTQPDSIYVGQTAQLNATFDGNYTYSWRQDTTLSDYFIADPIAKPRTTTVYTVLTRNQFGCIDTDTVSVYIRPPVCGEPIVFIPNAFTPDRDGHNEEWKIEGNNITEMNVAVYNRWGQKIFESNDQTIGWDGTFQGKALPPDVYGYYVTLVCDDGSRLFKKGNLTLLK
jgi:gliding motility-associated-like protein